MKLSDSQCKAQLEVTITFSRPSRKGQMSGAILPSMDFEDTIDIAVCIDMSGSIGEVQGKDFLGESQRHHGRVSRLQY